MGVLSVYHPDIDEFINAKSQNAERLKFFNLSVIVDDDFMRAVEDNRMIELHWPIYDENGGMLPKDKWDVAFTKRIHARDIWDLIMRKAYDNGEPGVIFYGNVNKMNPSNYIETIICTNPCAEYVAGMIHGDNINPKDFGGACNLGSLMLHNFVISPFTTNAKVDKEKLKDAVTVAVRMLDDIIDINKFPNQIYENYQKNLRTIGLGYTGFADMLAMLGYKYNSPTAILFAESLLKDITNWAYEASVCLAQQKGAFPMCNNEKHANTLFLCNNINKNIRSRIESYGIRNAKIQAVAPTGTLSLVYGNNCSSGIEPIFSLEYERKVKIGGQDDSNARITKIMDYAWWLYNDMKSKGERIDFTPEDIFITALEMSVDEHIDMLGVISKYTDMSVSKTINVPTEYSFEDTKNIYMKCWKLGIKGCTIFRPNDIRQGIMTTNSNTHTPKVNTEASLHRGDIINCSNDLVGKKRKVMSGCGSLHVLAFFDPITGDMQEVYLNKGSTGGCLNFMTGLSRTISLLCRAGVDIYTIKDQLDSTGVCPSYATRTAMKHDTSVGSCCPMAIGNALVDMYKEMIADISCDDADEDAEEDNTLIVRNTNAPKCPECGEPMVMEGGCNSCKSCGYSKCGV